MKKIMLVFGTRPEAVKMCPLVAALRQRPADFRTEVCVTGQHREMLDQVLRIFDVHPDYDLNIMQPGQDLFDITSRVLSGMRDVLRQARPDMVLVHGDTTTSVAATLAAFYEHIPVGHVEAGLRTYNPASPWPEEINRQLTDRIASCLFAPTEQSRSNLLSEHIDEANILVTGNTVIDALHQVVSRMAEDTALQTETERNLEAAGYPAIRLADGRRLVLVTGHRRENFGDGFLHICTALRDLADRHAAVDFVYPMHLNPHVRDAVRQVFGDDLHARPNLFLVEPLDYLEFVYLMARSWLVLTDSGGIQEEAPGLGKPVLVMRDTTERPEAVEAGTVELVGTSYDRIVGGVERLLNDREAYLRMSRAVNPYGDGHACGRIADRLNEMLI
ncbi:MAG: UDP-N-acetylglucosamine 2-epimerase (non-hydrolyzing) [Bacteroidales bacterium]|nr:UDP-N-acetylglucosamine 2-epimerase (non-hydrolyzing) [Bacteroidales bacterium]